jgi:hypothetical protein
MANKEQNKGKAKSNQPKLTAKQKKEKKAARSQGFGQLLLDLTLDKLQLVQHPANARNVRY